MYNFEFLTKEVQYSKGLVLYVLLSYEKKVL